MNTSFERTKEGKDEWLTPPQLITSLGEFDLDPCSPINRPWPTAKKHYTINDMGLLQDWNGRVWLNPPYGDETGNWLGKLKLHGNGIALVFGRTDTKYFQQYVFEAADAMYFIKGRLKFYHVSGIQAENCAGAPSVLIAYGDNNVKALKDFNYMEGKFIDLRNKYKFAPYSFRTPFLK